MSCRMNDDPVLEAALRDFLAGLPQGWPSWTVPQIWNRFADCYDTTEWYVDRQQFAQFFIDVGQRNRCGHCGRKSDAYFIPGDKLCLLCEEAPDAVHS